GDRFAQRRYAREPLARHTDERAGTYIRGYAIPEHV
ncbi:MAG: hypothetical protein AVDCRST_MAG14-183, partial [uncultured Rubrobacteraceae bacterium]